MSTKAQAKARAEAREKSGIVGIKAGAIAKSKSIAKAKAKTAAQRKPREERRVPLRNRDLTNAALLRLAKRAGTKRVSSDVYDYLRGVSRYYLESLLHDSLEVMQYARRTTLQSDDAFTAMSIQGYSGAIGLDNKGKLVHYRKGTKKRTTNVSGEGQRVHRFKPGTVALRDVRKLQKKSDNLVFQQLPFKRLLTAVGKQLWNESPGEKDPRYTKTFVAIAQFYTEYRLIRVLRSATILALHAKRQTIITQDVDMARRLSNDYDIY